MGKVVTIAPVSRIEGHARIAIHLDDAGNVEDAFLNVQSLRGFEQFVVGRPAEEVPRIVSRICGICPWMHHIAAVKAVDMAFGITPTETGQRLRELCLVLSHVTDKILHFFFLASPDFVIGPEADYAVRNVFGIARQNPELAEKVVRMRQLGHRLLDRFAGKAIHPIAGVVGGFAKPMTEAERVEMLKGAETLFDFARYALDFGIEQVLAGYAEELANLGTITTGFLGTVDPVDGSLQLYDGVQRLMKPDGSYIEFAADSYASYLGERVVPWSYAKMVYAKGWGEGFDLDPAAPRGIYRANTLARLNVCEKISTPEANAALEQFRSRFGRPVQQTLLYHWARLIEMVYGCERVIELLSWEGITDPEVRGRVQPGAGRGVGVVEAPRGTLIHDYTTDRDGVIESANLIVGTTHNIAPMNMSVKQAATSLIHGGRYDEGLLNRVEMALRAYDP